MGFLHHEPCPKCGSKDNLARYEDGGATCQGHHCDYWERKGTDIDESKKPRRTKNMSLPEIGEFVAIPQRGITEETCRRMKYSIGSYTTRDKVTGELDTRKAHIVHVPDQDGRPVASKIRMKGKDFRYVGATDMAGLVFQDVWSAGSSRRLVITEGEMDALSVSQIQDNKYAVVSLPNGTKSAVEVCGRARDYINSFPEVVLMFDMDEPGRDAAREVSRLFDDKVKIAQLPLPDANAMLLEGRGKEVVNALFNAQVWSPDGLVKLSSLKDAMKKPVEWGKPWCFPSLTEFTYGRRPGELYFLGAGVGIGKTSFILKQFVQDITSNEKSAAFLLEQPVIETGKRMAGELAGKMFHLPPEAGNYTADEQDAAVDALCEYYDPDLYNHFGAKDWNTIRDNIRWLAVCHGVAHFHIDHITALVAHADDEKRAIEQMTEEMSSICQELGINLYVVSHLATPQGTPHEEGGRVMARHFKGSRSIAQWGHYMIAFERNTQHPDEFVRSVTTVRIVKDRYTGQATGKTFLLGFDRATGRLYELSPAEVKRYEKLAGDDDQSDYAADF